MTKKEAEALLKVKAEAEAMLKRYEKRGNRPVYYRAQWIANALGEPVMARDGRLYPPHADERERLLSVGVKKLRWRPEAQPRDKESKLQHQLGIQLIDAGYRILAIRLHPDTGGSQEAMARLNRVRDILKGAI
jgi:hypothetical protein